MGIKIGIGVATIALGVFFAFQWAGAQEGQALKSKNPIEVGTVNWSRDFETTLKVSEETGKPVFVLFQEVPGCTGCKTFGKEVLSDPLLVEAIESEFLPVVVYNNRSSGSDKEILDRYDEPAWNYQVIRFLDGKGDDIVERQDRIWSIEGVANRMIETLETAERPVPNYLRSIAELNDDENHQMVAFSMFCFWTGEYHLGKIDGVIGTEAGFLDGHEVTLVKYDENRIGIDDLARQASNVKCADGIYTRSGKNMAGLSGGFLDNSYRPARASDQKRQIGSLKGIEKIPAINSMQLTKINSLYPDSVSNALSWLSPSQREYFDSNIR